MMRKNNATGFSLVELLLVLAIMGIISGIAIPAFLGQRRRARVVGDAQSNAQILRMQMETTKADTGSYGTSGAVYSWTTSGTAPSSGVGAGLNFTPKGTTQMNYKVTVGGGGLTYLIQVTDPTIGGATMLKMDQNGAISSLYILK